MRAVVVLERNGVATIVAYFKVGYNILAFSWRN
jgi:hypothetical protein